MNVSYQKRLIMDPKSRTRTETVLKFMNVFAWISFILLMVYAGGVLFSYVLIAIDHSKASGFFPGRDMSKLLAYSYGHYTMVVAFIFALAAMKAFVAYQATKVISKVKLDNPFRTDVVWVLESISYSLLVIWMVGVFATAYTSWLGSYAVKMDDESATIAGLLVAGLVFVISQVFKRGVEIQSENELTV